MGPLTTVTFTLEERFEGLKQPGVQDRVHQLFRTHNKQEMREMIAANPQLAQKISGSIYAKKPYLAETIAIAEWLLS